MIFDAYQSATYPNLESSHLHFDGLQHPLLNRDEAVGNDFAFTKDTSLLLLTGSNMSGKSTFLRAVGLNQILANLGAAVFAKAMATQPQRVMSCIEISDSLRDGFSYFYAEVKRLKELVDVAGGKENTVYLIDEIFRGTNNRERLIGSRAVISALASAKHAQGIVSTHDLELASLENHRANLVCYHFREEIESGQMVFKYQLRPGPSPTTNALRIMQLAGLELGNLTNEGRSP